MQKKCHGPAISLVVSVHHPTISYPVKVDLAPTAAVICPFPRAVTWPRPDSRWPSEDKADQVKQKGISLVAKKDLFWQISYSKAEKELVKDVDQDGGCRKKVHRIVKLLNQDHWTRLSSYVIKVRKAMVTSSTHFKCIILMVFVRKSGFKILNVKLMNETEGLDNTYNFKIKVLLFSSVYAIIMVDLSLLK